MEINEIRNMTVNQRILVMEQIWDSLIEDQYLPDSPPWHQDVLEHRRKRIESGDASFLSIAELKKLKTK
jgi:putative addiction module component